MGKLLSRLVSVSLGVVFVAFLFANRQPVALGLIPTAVEEPALKTIPLPLWAWLTLFLLVGVLLGGSAAWLSGGEARARARVARRELQEMKRAAAAAKPASGASQTGEPPLLIAES